MSFADAVVGSNLRSLTFVTSVGSVTVTSGVLAFSGSSLHSRGVVVKDRLRMIVCNREFGGSGLVANVLIAMADDVLLPLRTSTTVSVMTPPAGTLSGSGLKGSGLRGSGLSGSGLSGSGLSRSGLNGSGLRGSGLSGSGLSGSGVSGSGVTSTLELNEWG